MGTIILYGKVRTHLKKIGSIEKPEGETYKRVDEYGRKIIAFEKSRI